MFSKLKISIIFTLATFVIPLLWRPELIIHWQNLVMLGTWVLLTWLEPDTPHDVPVDSNSKTVFLTAWVLLLITVCDWAYSGRGDASPGFVYTGIFILSAGFILRLWSVWLLGPLFSQNLLVQPAHRIVCKGPFSLVRHPAYLGSLMLLTGQALFLGNMAIALICGLFLGHVYLRRIDDEEKLLRSAFDTAYDRYSAKTWKLIPFII